MDRFPLRACGGRGLFTSSLGLGAAALGHVADDSPAERERAAATLETAYALGIRHVDTSPAYGKSEERLGIAVKRTTMKDLTISTKVGTRPERRGSYARDDIRWSLEFSLKALGRDYVDIALIHDPLSMDPVLKRGDGFDALHELRREGLCQNVGLGVHEHEFHHAALDSEQVDVILTYGDFNIIRHSAVSLIERARSMGIGILLGSPHMHGFLATDTEPHTVLADRPWLRNWYAETDFHAAQDWWIWCKEHQVSLRHLNMRYVCEYADVSCILTGAANSGELTTNIDETQNAIPSDVWNEALLKIEEDNHANSHGK